MYIVTRYFTDAQDNSYAYHEGDKFPRDGMTVSDQRIQDLMSGRNFQRIPLIKEVKEVSKKNEEPKQEVVWTAEDIQKMPYMKLKSVAKHNDISIDGKEASMIRSELIEKLGL